MPMATAFFQFLFCLQLYLTEIDYQWWAVVNYLVVTT